MHPVSLPLPHHSYGVGQIFLTSFYVLLHCDDDCRPLNIVIYFVSSRWLTLLLSQEFPLPDVLRIWDSLFADENRFDFLIYICCSMIM